MRLYKVRSAIVHTATSEMSELADIAAIRSLAERMADGKYVSVDVMSDWCATTGAPWAPWRAAGLFVLAADLRPLPAGPGCMLSGPELVDADQHLRVAGSA
jgi:hypothetical protein